VLLWLAADPSAISEEARALILGAPGGLAVSSISAFEVGQKAAAGKLSLPMPVDKWFAAMLESHALRELPVSGVIAARATLLPAIHRDPFDRLLIATAQHHRLALLTPDPVIAKYPGLKVRW
jgi:PIN domain nuclease of toxin-antitoxin system